MSDDQELVKSLQCPNCQHLGDSFLEIESNIEQIYLGPCPSQSYHMIIPSLVGEIKIKCNNCGQVVISSFTIGKKGTIWAPNKQRSLRSCISEFKRKKINKDQKFVKCIKHVVKGRSWFVL